MTIAHHLPAPLKTIFYVALLLVASILGAQTFKTLDRHLYDAFMTNAYTQDYGGDSFLPSIKMLVVSEKTTEALGPWTSERTSQLENTILQAGALGIAVYPGARTELQTPLSSKIIEASPIGEPGSSIILDSDGICRRVALATFQKDGPQPTLPLRVLAWLNHVPENAIRYGPRSIELGFRRIPTDSSYRILVRFRSSNEDINARIMAQATSNRLDPFYPIGVESFENPKFQAAYLRNYKQAVILLGTGFKEASAQVDTPISPLNDFKVDACAIETVMGGFQISELTTAQQCGLLLIVIMGCHLLFQELPVILIAIFWALLQIAWLNLAAAAFTFRVFLGYSLFLTSSTLVTTVLAIRRYQQAKKALLRFGGAGAEEAGYHGDETIFDEIKEKIATIVFTNVPSYLKELERHGSPDDFFEKRQAYAQLLSDVFRHHKGVILDYQGDFQMVGFNVELRTDDPDHAMHAIEASLDFLAQLPQLTSRWTLKDGQTLGSAHCGICSGQVACGHVGSRRHDGGRIAQAAIGDTSNVAARLLGAAMKLGEPIILAMTTAEATGGKVTVDPLEAVPLKGKTHPVPIARPKSVSKEAAS